MRKEKFRFRKFLNKQMRDCIHKDRTPSLRVMKITGSSFSGNLVFVDVLVTHKTRVHSEIVLTMSPVTAEFMRSALTKNKSKQKNK